MSDGGDIIVIKLGGSLITDKRSAATVRSDVLARLAQEIAGVRPHLDAHLILGHGSGSFGHMAAARHDLGKGPYTHPGRLAEGERLRGIAETQNQAARLHRMVVAALLQAGETPFSWAPSTALSGHAGQPAGLAGAIDTLWQALHIGLLPVLYGDVILDHSWGAAIVSTETLVRHLVDCLRESRWTVRRILWCGETDGLLDEHNKPLPRIDSENFEQAKSLIGATRGTDVTGGMHLRLETTYRLAQQGVESWLINGTRPGVLQTALEGEEVPGTRVVPPRK